MFHSIPLTYYIFTGLLNFFTTLTLSILVVAKKNYQSNVNRRFSIFALSVAVWSIFYFLWLVSKEQSIAEFYLRTCMMPVLFMPALFFHFVVCFLDIKLNKIYLIINYILGGLFSFTVYSPLYAYNSTAFFAIPYWPQAGPIFHLALSHFSIIVVLSCYLMYKTLKKSKGVFRYQLLYVFIGSLIGFTSGSTVYFGWYKILIPPVLNFLVSVYMGIIAYAIIKYRLMDIKVAVTRAGIFLTVYSLFLGFPFWLGYKLFGGIQFWWVPTSIATGMALVVPITYRFLKGKAEDVILARQRQYQRFLLNAARAMVRERDLKRLFKLIVIITKRGIKPEFAAVFLHDEEHDRYVLGAVRKRGIIPNNLSIPVGHKIIDLMKKAKAPLSQEDFHSIFPDIRQGLPIHLIVPVCTDGKLLGFLMLGEKLDGSAYSDDDISVFKILSQQAALAIEYCLFMEKDKEFRERFAKVEKLSTFGDMASCAAHQFGNRLTAFSNLSLGVTGELLIRVDSRFAKT